MLELEPGLRTIVERLPGDRAAVYWIEVTPWGPCSAGSFEGTTEEAWRAVEEGPPGAVLSHETGYRGPIRA